MVFCAIAPLKLQWTHDSVFGVKVENDDTFLQNVGTRFQRFDTEKEHNITVSSPWKLKSYSKALTSIYRPNCGPLVCVVTLDDFFEHRFLFPFCHPQWETDVSVCVYEGYQNLITIGMTFCGLYQPYNLFAFLTYPTCLWQSQCCTGNLLHSQSLLTLQKVWRHYYAAHG